MSTRKIIVTRPYGGSAVARAVREDAARAAAASRSRRQASYAFNRLIGTTPGTGRSLMATGRGSMGVGEVKFFDTDVIDPAASLPVIGSVTASEPGVAFTGITVVNKVLQGASSYNRIGNKIQIKSIQFRATLFTSAANGQARVMIVYDRQPNGAFPGIQDILSDNISTAPGYHSGVNMANRERFLIMRDQFLNFSSVGETNHTLNMFIKTKSDTTFKASGNTIGDISSGALYLVAFASGAVYMTDAHFRLRYFD